MFLVSRRLTGLSSSGSCGKVGVERDEMGE